MISVAAVMTSHNRRDVTLAALGALFAQQSGGSYRVQAYLSDAGSSDGTPECVRHQFPDVRVLSGSTSTYWSGGMRAALSEAAKEDFDAYLWLNDDTLLFPHAVPSLLDVLRGGHGEGQGVIVVGSTSDPATGERTYGGIYLRQRWLRPLGLVPVPATPRPRRVDTMNGNVVLVSRAARRRLGDHDSVFTHAMSDIDYGLRARRAGIPVVLAPGYVGACSLRRVDGTWRDTELAFAARLRQLHSPKGLPFHEWRHLVRRHCGPSWPLPLLSPYVRIATSSLAKRAVVARPCR